MRVIRALTLAGVLTGAVGCGDDDGGGGSDAGTPDAGSVVDACTTCAAEDAGSPGEDAGPGTDAGPVGDSFDAALEVTLPYYVDGRIFPAGDLDYFRFEGSQGDWIEIDTLANLLSDPDSMDSVITLFDATRERIAEVDTRQPGDRFDARLVIRLPATGTYYLIVQDSSTYRGEPGREWETNLYQLSIRRLGSFVPEMTTEMESGDDAASAQRLRERADPTYALSVVGGTFRDATDVDVFSFTIPTGGNWLFRATSMAHGLPGNGSTASTRAIWITGADGTSVVARVETSALHTLSPTLAPGEYLLWVESGGEPGSNDFYVMDTWREVEDVTEALDATNGAAETAEPLAIDTERLRPSSLSATLGAGDVDHFRIDAPGPKNLGITCASQSAGSGVEGLSVTLLDATGATELATASETASQPATIPMSVVAAGSYVLRLTKSGQSAAIAGDWVRCSVTMYDP